MGFFDFFRKGFKYEELGYKPPYYYHTVDIKQKLNDYIDGLKFFQDSRTKLITYEKRAYKEVRPQDFNRADVVTWASAALAGLAMLDDDSKITKDLIESLYKATYDVTHVTGYIPRSYVIHDEEKANWMVESSSGQDWYRGKFAFTNNTNEYYFYRRPSSKGVYNHLVNAFALALDSRAAENYYEMLGNGSINYVFYSRAAENYYEMLGNGILNSVSYLIRNKWVGRGFSLQTDDFTDDFLNFDSGLKVNGYNMVVRASLLNAYWKVTGDTLSHKEMVEHLRNASHFFNKLSRVIQKVGRHNFPLTYSADYQVTFALNALQLTNKNVTVLKYCNRIRKYIQRWAKWYQNPVFDFPYKTYTKPGGINLQSLIDFPSPRKVLYTGRKVDYDGAIVPLSRRPVSTYYWKDSPHVELTNVEPGLNEANGADLIYACGLLHKMREMF